MTKTWCLGPLETNAHVWAEGTDAWLFDCPPSPQNLLDEIQAQGGTIRGVFLTHAHIDHIGGLDDLRRRFPGVPVWIHRAEASWLTDPEANLSSWMGAPFTCDPASETVDEGDVLEVGSRSVRVLHLPGHSPGSVAYWFLDDALLMGGDVLFRGSVGRWDLPGGDSRLLQKSVERLAQLPDETRILPGHGGSTTVARERTDNPYLRSPDAWSD